MLYHLSYVSASTGPIGPELIADILKVSARNNARDGISGVLMYHDQLFFQVLEGEKDVVERCFSRILRDPRHFAINPMWENPITFRVFSDWSMGYAGSADIESYTGKSYRTLTDLLSGDDATESSNLLALGLARQMFDIFTQKAGYQSGVKA